MKMKTMFVRFILTIFFGAFLANMNAQTVMFGVDPKHTGVYDASLPGEVLLVKKWKLKTGGMIFSSAVVANDVIYIGSDDSCLYAVDTTGILKWKFQSNGIIRSTPAVKDTIVFFTNYDGMAYGINANTGNEIWNFETDGELHFSQTGLFGWTPSDMLMNDPWDFYESSPVIMDTILYFGCGANIYALQNETGQLIWKYTSDDVVHSSPAVANGSIFFGGWSGRFYTLDALTGAEKWTYNTGTDPTHLMQGIQSSATIVDTLVIIGARDAQVYTFDVNTGTKIWSLGFGSSWMPSSFAYFDETIFTGSSEGGGLKAIGLQNGNLQFATSKNFYFTFSSPVVGSETAFIGCMNGSLFAVDVNTGDIKCRFDTDGRISDPLNAILDNGNLNPAVFDPVSGYPYEQAVEYVRRLLTAGSIASTPAIDNNIIYFGSSDSCIYAIQDAGHCKPNVEVSSHEINLGEFESSVTTDTTFYVFNKGECLDLITISVDDNTISTLKDGIEISPPSIVLSGGDSASIQLSINTADLSARDYTVNIISQSETNEYKLEKTKILFTVKAGSGIPKEGLVSDKLIFPNPFVDFVNVRSDCGNKIIISNTAGNIVYQIILQTDNSQIDLGFLKNGVYLVIITSVDACYFRKIVKCN
jgi:eukaryotic-like serine/threonine-protein kinase